MPIFILLAFGPRIGNASKDSFNFKLEFQTLGIVRSTSQVQAGSLTGAFSGIGYNLRAGTDLGMLATLAYYRSTSQPNEQRPYGSDQTKSDSEFGGLLRIDSTEMLGIIVGGGAIQSRISSGQLYAKQELSGIRAFVGFSITSCMNQNVCGLFELTGTAMGKYSKVKGEDYKKPVHGTGYDASVGMAFKY